MTKFKEVIPNIAEGFDFSKGDIVLLQFWGENDDLHILDEFAIEVAKKGAFPIKWQHSREFMKEYYAKTPDEYLTFPDKFFEIFKVANAVVDICMFTPPTPHKDFPREKIQFYRENMMKLFRSVTEDKKYFIQVKVPNAENAAAVGIDYELFEKSIIDSVCINYKELKETCEKVVTNLKDKKNVEIHTGDNNKLTFSIKDRPWYKDDGNGDIPPGEVYIAPIEESGEGSILVPQLFLDGNCHKNVTLTFKEGILLESSLPELMEHVKSCPGDSDKLAEFGIGLNKNVKELIGYPAYDEKAVGTIHIAIGMNVMFGGENNTPLHMDFILKPFKVLIDGEEFNI